MGSRSVACALFLYGSALQVALAGDTQVCVTAAKHGANAAGYTPSPLKVMNLQVFPIGLEAVSQLEHSIPVSRYELF